MTRKLNFVCNFHPNLLPEPTRRVRQTIIILVLYSSFDLIVSTVGEIFLDRKLERVNFCAVSNGQDFDVLNVRKNYLFNKIFLAPSHFNASHNSRTFPGVITMATNAAGYVTYINTL